MKRYLLLLYVTAFLCSYAGAQDKVLDSAYLKCVYKLSYVPDTLKPGKRSGDILYLMVGEKVSTFFSYAEYRADSALKADIQNGVPGADTYMKNPKGAGKYARPGLYSQYRLYLNYPKNKITTTDMIVSDRYIYEDNAEKIKWQIRKDTMTINGILCQKAMTDFHGRSYTAWFSADFPVSAGPYKFNGLPGLITDIADANNNYHYELTSVEKLTQKVAIVLNADNYIKTNRKAFRKGIQAAFDNPYQALANKGAISGDLKWLQKPIPYNPIELY